MITFCEPVEKRKKNIGPICQLTSESRLTKLKSVTSNTTNKLNAYILEAADRRASSVNKKIEICAAIEMKNKKQNSFRSFLSAKETESNQAPLTLPIADQ